MSHSSHAPFDRVRAGRFGVLLAALALGTGLLLLLTDGRTLGLLRNTLFLCAVTCGVTLPLGTVLAWLLVRTDLPGRKVALAMLGVMLFVPLYLQAAAWQAGFGLQGWFTMTCHVPLWLEGWAGAIWVHSMSSLPWVVLIAGAGFWLVEPELEEQALLDGSPWQVFWHVTLPGATAALGVAALWVAIVTAGEMSITDLFAVRTYAEEIYTRFAVGPQPDDPPLGILSGLVLSSWLVLAGLLIVARLAPHDRPITTRERRVFRLGRWRLPLAVLVALVLLAVVGVPLASLSYKAGVTVTQVESIRVRNWSLWKCLDMAAGSPARYGREFGWSLLIGGLAATASAATAVALAWFARRGGFRAASVLTVTALCLAAPGPLVGLGVIRLLNRPEIPLLVELYDRSILPPFLALWIRSLAPATLIMWHALRTLPSEMLDSAAVDGAGPFARLWWIALPCRLPALALAWIVAFALALGDLAGSVLVVPPGMTTLSIRIFGLLHYGVEDRVAGICLALVGVFAVVAAAVVWLAGRWRGEESAKG